MRAVPIRPLNVHACTSRHVHLDRLGISHTRHNFSIAQLRAGLSVPVKNGCGSDKAALYCDLLEFSEKRRSDARLRSPAYFFLSRLIFFAISSTSFGFNSAKTLSTMLAIAADSAFESLELGAVVFSLSGSVWVAGGSGG